MTENAVEDGNGLANLMDLSVHKRSAFENDCIPGGSSCRYPVYEYVSTCIINNPTD